MRRPFEPALVTRLLERTAVHGTAASELYVVLHAMRAAALALTAIATLTTWRTRDVPPLK